MTVFNIVHSVYLFYVTWTDMSENKLFVTVIELLIFQYKQLQKSTIHQVTTILATSKIVLFLGHSHLLTIDTDDPIL